MGKKKRTEDEQIAHEEKKARKKAEKAAKKAAEAESQAAEEAQAAVDAVAEATEAADDAVVTAAAADADVAAVEETREETAAVVEGVAEQAADQAAEADPAAQGDAYRAAVAAALADVDALALEGKDRKYVLQALLDARLGEVMWARQGTVVDATDSGRVVLREGFGDRAEAAASRDAEALEAIARGLGMPLGEVEKAFAVEGGEVAVVIPSALVDEARARGTRQLGQLIIAGRQLAGIEEWTAAAEVRRVAVEYARLDASNFAAALGQLEDVALIRGTGQNRELMMTRPGIEQTAALLKELLAG